MISLHCVACNNELSEGDLFKLPDGETNDLCKRCLRLVKEDLRSFDSDLPQDLDMDVYTLRMLCYTGSHGQD
jgi:NAD-dependent SIR2 family protein deacetylase